VDITRSEKIERELDILVPRCHEKRVETEGERRALGRHGRRARSSMTSNTAKQTALPGRPITASKPSATAPP